MNEKIKQHLVKYNQSKGYSIDDDTLVETLFNVPVIGEQDEEEHRWWIQFTCFVEIDGMIIGFERAKSTGDMSVNEMGWEFDPTTIFEAEKYPITIMGFRAKE
jgi:hypothetical protein